jgi:hypothetical protein
MMGTFDWCQRQLIVTTSRTKRSSDFIAHLQALDRLQRSLSEPIGSLSSGCQNMHLNSTISRLSGVTLRLNKAHHTFIDPDVLDRAIHQAVSTLNSERKLHPLGNQRISA